jgi:uncharacterized membrane protein YjfL (UPF0719 family)
MLSTVLAQDTVSPTGVGAALETALAGILPTLIYFIIGIALFAFSIWLFAKLAPFSVRKEIETDQNVALGVVMGSALIGIAIILAAVIMS